MRNIINRHILIVENGNIVKNVLGKIQTVKVHVTFEC